MPTTSRADGRSSVFPRRFLVWARTAALHAFGQADRETAAYLMGQRCAVARVASDISRKARAEVSSFWAARGLEPCRLM